MNSSSLSAVELLAKALAKLSVSCLLNFFLTMQPKLLVVAFSFLLTVA